MVLSWSFRWVEVVAMARWKSCHGLDERQYEVPQVVVAVDAGKRRQEPRTERVASEERRFVLWKILSAKRYGHTGTRLPVPAISRSIIAFSRLIKDERVSKILRSTLMIWSASFAGHT